MPEPITVHPCPSLTEEQWLAFAEAQLLFRELHPERHCPVCGRHEFRTPPGEYALQGIPSPHGDSHRRFLIVATEICANCGFVILVDIRTILSVALSDADARRLWPKARDRERWVLKRPRGYEPPEPE